MPGAGLALSAGRKAALVGRNGSGKSTLLTTLQKVADVGRPPEHVELRGRLTIAPGARLASLPQSPQLASAGTVREYLDVHAGNVSRAWLRHEELARTLATGHPGEGTLEAYGEALEAMERLGACAYPQRQSEVLAGLGLPADLLDRPVAELSGGQAERVALAGLLLSQADLLLLDEPSNHLDLASLRFLARWVRDSAAALLLVTHDRDLIDTTVDEVLEIEEHTARLRQFGGGYSFYAECKRSERESQSRRFAEQESRRAQLEASARGVATRASRFQGLSQNDFYRGKSARVARQASAQQARIARELHRLTEPEPPAQPRLTVPPTARRQGLLLWAEGVSFTSGGRPILDGVCLQVHQDSRLAVVGPNGSGKSTLLRLLVGDLTPTGGRVEHAPGLRIGFLRQVPAVADPRASLLDFALARAAVPAGELRAALGKVLFADPARVRVGQVSPGELRRIECAALFASAPDLAVLDEPTNHLDLLSVEMLEAALREYEGALIVASHDTRLLEALVPTRTLDLG